MSERLLSASKKSKIVSKNRLLTGLAIGLSALALGACGKDTAKDDKGGDAIAKCPVGYVTKEQKPIKDRSAFSAAMGNAVTQLASQLNTDYSGRVEVLNRNLYTQSGLEQRAAVEVFHITEYGDVMSGQEYFKIDSNETRVDDLSEQFCSQGGETYESAQAARAIGAMKAAGVDITDFNR